MEEERRRLKRDKALADKTHKEPVKGCLECAESKARVEGLKVDLARVEGVWRKEVAR